MALPINSMKKSIPNLHKNSSKLHIVYLPKVLNLHQYRTLALSSFIIRVCKVRDPSFNILQKSENKEALGTCTKKQ